MSAEPRLPYERALLLDGAMPARELALLYGIALSMPANPLVVELGSFKGRSSVAICEGLSRVADPRFVAIDPWLRIRMADDELYEPDSPDVDHVYRRFLRNLEPYVFVEPMRMTSIEASHAFADESVDWLFVDADHGFGAVRADLCAWYPKIKSGGLISGHDHSHFGVRWAVASYFGRVALWEDIWFLRKERPRLTTRPHALAVGKLREGLRRAPPIERAGRRVLRVGR
jgi:hypothetical protein